jgi:hypothetical protein
MRGETAADRVGLRRVVAADGEIALAPAPLLTFDVALAAHAVVEGHPRRRRVEKKPGFGSNMNLQDFQTLRFVRPSGAVAGRSALRAVPLVSATHAEVSVTCVSHVCQPLLAAKRRGCP